MAAVATLHRVRVRVCVATGAGVDVTLKPTPIILDNYHRDDVIMRALKNMTTSPIVSEVPHPSLYQIQRIAL